MVASELTDKEGSGFGERLAGGGGKGYLKAKKWRRMRSSIDWGKPSRVAGLIVLVSAFSLKEARERGVFLFMRSDVIGCWRKWSGVLVAAAGLALVLPGAHGAAGSLISKGPYLQAPASDTMLIMWESLADLPGKVRFGVEGQPDAEVGDVRPRMIKTATAGATNAVKVGAAPREFYIYEAALKDLKPGETYHYSVEFAGVRTATNHFKAFNPGAERVRFIAYGDSRSYPEAHARLTARFRQHAPDFILHTGDIVARGRDYTLWAREFFNPMANVINEAPFFPVIGNHEGDGTNYLAYFHPPGQRLWYSLDVGPAHVLGLDYRFTRSDSEQFRFAANDLMTSRAPWKIVMFHKPVFNIGGHVSDWGQTNYLPLFYRTKMDLVLAGHSHMYERFHPVAPRGERDWAITHITTGGGGAELYDSFDHPSLAVRESAHHYMVLEATRDALQARAIRDDGTLLDSFELKKTDGRMAADYLAQVYPEELLKLFYAATPSLASRVASPPGTNAPARLSLNLKPLAGWPAPARLEITLAPQSAPYYELEDPPLRATTPLTGQTNLAVWTTVRATGKRAITMNSDQELRPPLVLMAKVRCGEEETIAYGAPCRLAKTAATAADKP